MKVFKIVTTTRKDIQNKECELKETTCKKKKNYQNKTTQNYAKYRRLSAGAAQIH